MRITGSLTRPLNIFLSTKFVWTPIWTSFIDTFPVGKFPSIPKSVKQLCFTATRGSRQNKDRSCRSFTYLGAKMISRFSHVPHISKALNRANGACKSLYSVLKCSAPPLQKNKLFCYKQLSRPLLTFGFIFWSDSSPSQIERLAWENGRSSASATKSTRTMTIPNICPTKPYTILVTPLLPGTLQSSYRPGHADWKLWRLWRQYFSYSSVPSTCLIPTIPKPALLSSR